MSTRESSVDATDRGRSLGVPHSPSHALSAPGPPGAAESNSPRDANGNHDQIQSNLSVQGSKVKTNLGYLITISLILIYILTSFSVGVVQYGTPSKIPDSDDSVDSILSHSWHDLQQLSQSPHPYGSRSNDDVHDYILRRVRSIIGHENAKINSTVEDDVRRYLFRQDDVFDSSLPSGRVIYYEGNNILVKVPGRDPSLPGVLVSAHYDSVPTAFGTTDDGAGIASMLGILEAILHEEKDDLSPLRTIIFNFNNNEEFGLLGAESFFQHPWSKEVEFFVNLEGAGAGGRAVLFRGTDISVVNHFASSRAPHGNSVLQQGFDSRLIRSETDYKVYSRNGLRGLDIAFYTPRNIYHTKGDSIQGGSKEALYHMYGNALDTTLSLANASEDSLNNRDRAVYFDILGRYFYVLSLPRLFQMDIVLLFLLPAMTIPLLYFYPISLSFLSLVSMASTLIISTLVSYVIYCLNPFIVTSHPMLPFMAISVVALVTATILASVSRKLVRAKHQTLSSLLTMNIISWGLLVWSILGEYSGQVGWYVFSVVYICTGTGSILLLIGTIIGNGSNSRDTESKKSTVGHCNQTGSIHETSPQLNDQEAGYTSVDEHTSLLNHHNATLDSQDNASHDVLPVWLASQSRKSNFTIWGSFFEFLSFVLVVPVSVFAIISLSTLIIASLSAVPSESDHSTWVFYLRFMPMLALFLLLPTYPFLHFVHKKSTFPALFIFGFILTAFCVMSSPFDKTYGPLKMRVSQTISLNNLSHGAVVSVSGKHPFVQQAIHDLPSLKSQLPTDDNDIFSGNNNSSVYDSVLSCHAPIDGNEICEYRGLQPWLVNRNLSPPKKGKANKHYDEILSTDLDHKEIHRWMKVDVSNNTHQQSLFSDESILANTEVGVETWTPAPSPFGPFNADINIRVLENRWCSITFNSSNFRSHDSSQKSKSPVRSFRIYRKNDGLASSSLETESVDSNTLKSGWTRLPDKDVYTLYSGIDDITLHKLDWEGDYRIGIEWMPWYEIADSDTNGSNGNDNDNDNDEELFYKSKLGVTIACQWSELNQVMVDGHICDKVPAVTEIKKMTPDWISWANRGKGLVEVQQFIEL